MQGRSRLIAGAEALQAPRPAPQKELSGKGAGARCLTQFMGATYLTRSDHDHSRAEVSSFCILRRPSGMLRVEMCRAMGKRETNTERGPRRRGGAPKRRLRSAFSYEWRAHKERVASWVLAVPATAPPLSEPVFIMPRWESRLLGRETRDSTARMPERIIFMYLT